MPALYKRRMRLLPGGCPAAANSRPRDRAGNPASCFVLHHMGFFVPRRLRAGRWALTPPFHPFQAAARGAGPVVLFSVTLSVVPGLGRGGRPRVLRGMSPCGVRTFLPPNGGRSSALRGWEATFGKGRGQGGKIRRSYSSHYSHGRNGRNGTYARRSVATKNHPIINTPMANFPAMPATVPRKVPHVERPAGSRPWPPSNSPSNTPASGPTKSPTGP